MNVLLIGAVAAWNVLQNRVLPRWSYSVANAAGVPVFLALARRAGATDGDLGIDRSKLATGVGIGLAFGAAAGAVIAAVAKVRPRWFADTRVIGTNPAYETLVRIPIGTALFEEVVFRGALEATTSRHTANLLFGLWHILPTLETAKTNSLPAVSTVVGGVAVTGAAGTGFSWLRKISRSLAAPVVVHAAINVAGYLAATRTVSAAKPVSSGSTSRR